MDFNKYINENLWELRPITEDDNFIINKNNQFINPIDKNKLLRLLKSGYNTVYSQNPNFRRWKKDFKIPFNTLQEQMKKFLMDMKSNNVIVNPHINLTDGIGRGVYDKSNISSLAVLPKDVRNYLTKGKWVDIDMKNAHSKILLNICKLMGIDAYEYSGIQNYCDNREDIIKNAILHHYSISNDEYNKITQTERDNYRDEIKTLVIIVGYGGCYEKWCNDNGLPYNPLKEVQDYITSFNTITEKYVIPHNEDFYKKLERDYKRLLSTNIKKKKTTDLNKPKRTIISKFLQHYETLITGCIMDTLIKQNKIENKKISYEYDGFEITLKDYNKNKITPELITKLTKDKTGFDIEWSIKEKEDKITQSIEMLEKNKQETSSFPEEYLNYFDIDYFKSLKGDGYNRMKDYFEYFVKFAERPQPLFYVIENLPKKHNVTKETIYVRCINHFEEHHIRKLYGRFGCGELKRSGDEIKFLDKYFDDEDRKTYKSITFEPYNAPFNINYVDDNNLNTFTGYNNIIFNDKPLETEYRKKIVKPFIELVSGLVGEQNVETFMNCISHKIKYPTNPFPYGFVIMGSEGTGKNMVLNVIGNIIGKEHYISTANIDDVLGGHSEGLYHKLICNLNEVDLKQSKDKTNRFKAIISEDTITFNPKNVRPFETANYAFIIITSNESMPIVIDVISGDRRWFVFNGYDTNKMKYSEDNWRQLASYFNKPLFIRALYEELCSYDSLKYPFKKAKIENSKTKEYKKLAQYNIPIEINFLIDYIHFNGFYKDYCITNGMDYTCEEFFGWDEIPSKDFHSYDIFNKNITIRSKTFMETFNEWCSNTKYKISGIERNTKSFNNRFSSGLKLKTLELITEDKHTSFNINMLDLIKELHSKNFYELEGCEEWLNNNSSNKKNKPKKVKLELMDI